MVAYDLIATRIIKEQEQLMGPVAWYEAKKVKGLHVIDEQKGTIAFDQNSDNKAVVDSLVNQYSSMFGRAAKEVCKEAVSPMLADLNPSEVPASLW